VGVDDVKGIDFGRARAALAGLAALDASLPFPVDTQQFQVVFRDTRVVPRDVESVDEAREGGSSRVGLQRVGCSGLAG
jgi:hypothetical protein